ncbi:MAG: DUF2029 domain-containing protein [Thermoleophilaceae bacterium]|nr:DUF2029 domain-containing protein [Thermoleophilaceae bacterium]
MELRAKRSLLLAVGLLALLAPLAPAELVAPASQTEAPANYKRSAKQVIAIAKRDAKVRGEYRSHPKLVPSAYTDGPGRWQVSFFNGRKELAQVRIDDRTGGVFESWTGPQVAWKMARGYEGAFGRKVNAPYVWIPFCILFLAPFFDPRRPFRLLHLDLLVLIGFGVSHIFFNRGEISTSVPLVYPLLVYLLLRLLWAGFRPRERAGPLIPVFPVVVVAMALVFLVGFRVALNVADANVIDVGYAGVIGADRIMDGEELYDGKFPEDNQHGDTYGPAAYLAYVPFEQALPWSGSWDDLPAAHAASVAFDLLTLLGLFLLGRRLRDGPAGTTLGVALAYGWAAFPYSLFALESNSNDSLVALLLVGTLLVITSAPARGAMLALATAVKFAPIALAPLFATGRGPWRPKAAVGFALTFGAVAALLVLAFLPPAGLEGFWDRTIGNQLDRDAPFSIWGQYELPSLHAAVRILAVLLAASLAFVPRTRSPVQIAALGAAVLLALQLGMTYWFYLYIVWFFPFALVALFSEHAGPGARAALPSVPARERASAELQPVA